MTRPSPSDLSDSSRETDFHKVDSPSTDKEGKHQGMTLPQAQTGRSGTGEPHTPKDESIKASVGLPHERDQDSEMTGDRSSPEVEQAAKDIKGGLKDTSRGAETDLAYQKVKHGA
ncbi:MAG: hypothetical protein V4731_03765 [Pseudomonadota bacterium]